MPPGICDKILDMHWKMPVVTEIAGVVVDENTACIDNNNEMMFVFHNTLDTSHLPANGDSQQTHRDANGDCASGYTGENCDIFDDNCNGHGWYFYEFDTCVCDEGYGGNNCEITCPNEEYPFIMEGGCYSCASSMILPPEACDICPSRFLADGVCYPCSLPVSGSLTAEECAKCGDERYMNGSSCYKNCTETEFMNVWRYCYSCDDPNDIYMSGMENTYCKKCNGQNGASMRYYLQDYIHSGGSYYPTPNFCVKTCPEGTTADATTQNCVVSSGSFVGSSGSVYPCSYTAGPYTTAAECAKCDETETPRYMKGSACLLVSCSNGYFADKNGYCYSCSGSDPVSSVTSAECAKCDSTDTPRYMSGNYCYKKS